MTHTPRGAAFYVILAVLFAWAGILLWVLLGGPP
jgi:hypothetical protein